MAKRSGVMAGFLIISADQIIKDHALIYEDGVVVDIVPNEKVAGDKNVEDRRDCIVCPSFVNAHSHMYNVVVRGIKAKSIDSSLSLKPMLEKWWWPDIENQVNHEHIELTTRYSAYEMLRNGITCVDDILEAPNSAPGCLAIEENVLSQAGMRGILSLESSERISKENGMLCLKENYDFTKAQKEKEAAVRGMMCIHTTFSCSSEFLLEARRQARELDDFIQMHCAEGPDESRYCMEDHGKLPMEYYDELGFLDDRVVAGQCVIMDPKELDIMAKRGVRVTHQPYSNCGYGCGVSPTPAMLDLGIPVGLGTDSFHNDYFEVMRMAALLHKGVHMDSSLMPANVVFRMATELGAKSIGYDNIGTLDRGNFADYLVIDADFPTPLTGYNIMDQMLMRRNSSDIKAVYVAGECVLRDGIPTNFDGDKAKRDIYEFTEDFWRK